MCGTKLGREPPTGHSWLRQECLFWVLGYIFSHRTRKCKKERWVSGPDIIFWGISRLFIEKCAKRNPEWGPEEKYGICRLGWGSLAKFGPDLIFKSHQALKKWPAMSAESTGWAENLSRSMPGPLHSVWDGSNPLQGALLGKKLEGCSQTAR